MNPPDSPGPEDEAGGAPEPPGDAASTASTPATDKKQDVTADLSQVPLPRRPLDDRPGEQLSLDGLDLRTDTEQWLADFAAALAQVAAFGRPFTAAEVRARVPGAAPNPNWIGLLFADAARAGEIVPLGAVQSSIPSRRRGLCRIWRAAA